MKPAIMRMVVDFARTIGAQKSEHLAGGDGEGQVVHGPVCRRSASIRFFVVIMGALERSSAKEVQIFLTRGRRSAQGFLALLIDGRFVLFQYTPNLGQRRPVRPMRAMSSGNSNHLRPHLNQPGRRRR